MVIESLPIKALCVEKPTTTLLPETGASKAVILEQYHVDLLPVYGYTTREYLISGEAAGQSFCTRLLLRSPAEPTRFSGLVVEEPSHLWGGTSIWRHINRWIMRNGHAWLEVDSQAPSAIGKIKNINPTRYQDMHFIPSLLADEFAANVPFVTDVSKETLYEKYCTFKAKWWSATSQCPEILAAASYALRSGELGVKAQNVILTGLSQTGGVTRRFITHSSHLRLPDGSLPFEGFIPCQSGGPALPDFPFTKVIELLGESEFQSVRFPCGVSGQLKDTIHRRPESDSFRIYEVAGMAHRESRYSSALDSERLAGVDLHGAKWSTFPNSFIYHAVFEAMEKWITRSINPPQSALLQTVETSDTILRDNHGNALGGVRTLHTEVPLSRLVAATPKGRPSWYCGSEWSFSHEIFLAIYGSVGEYRHRAGEAIQRQIESGFLLPEDAEILRRETVEQVIA
ncbi:signal peptide-containing protein [Penicillium verhagenii]|nr:signal peptide-containing protein [Penicillium verhagenii]